MNKCDTTTQKYFSRKVRKTKKKVGQVGQCLFIIYNILLMNVLSPFKSVPQLVPHLSHTVPQLTDKNIKQVCLLIKKYNLSHVF